MPKKRRGGSVGRKSSQAAIKKASRSQETGETLGDSAGNEIYTTKKKLDKKSEPILQKPYINVILVE